MRVIALLLISTLYTLAANITGEWIVDPKASQQYAKSDYDKIIIDMQVKKRGIYKFLQSGQVEIYQESNAKAGMATMPYSFKNGKLSGSNGKQDLDGELLPGNKLRFTLKDAQAPHSFTVVLEKRAKK